MSQRIRRAKIVRTNFCETGCKGPNTQNAISVSDAKNEVKTMVLLMTENRARDRKIA